MAIIQKTKRRAQIFRAQMGTPTQSVEGREHEKFRVSRVIGITMLLFSIGFNLWIYRLEPTALGDPNDNTFQFALVDRTNQIWDFVQQKCSSKLGAWNLVLGAFCQVNYLADHWVPNWAQGYNLPYYYSHIPQITIVATWRLFSILGPQISLFTFYHYVIYLLLCLFPLSLFLALRIIGLSWITAGIGALIASHLSTDGLYGLDPSSFLWRGYGLSSQLYAMVFLPLAIAYTWKLFQTESWRKNHESRGMKSMILDTKTLILAILFLAATTAGHLGIGIIAFISIGIFAISPFIQSILKQSWDAETINYLSPTIGKLLLIFGGAGLLLAYWILPILVYGNYHNISVWDGIWKFDSFGYRDVLTNLFNGDLFDFGRFPVMTALTITGFFLALAGGYFGFALLFVFWILMYFGRTTWGPLIDLIPGMSEYHLSRFIVGVHISGLFLIPISIDWTMSRVSVLFPSPRRRSLFVLLGIISAVLLTVSIYPQTIRYASHNDFLIKRGNTQYQKNAEDIDALITILRTKIQGNPGRVFAGRGGSWGKNFLIAETPMYMHLSTYGIPVILWLPETWSPNSDTEQYFSENNPAHYSLYNVRYVATPATLNPEQIQPFWRLTESGKTWKLYEVATDGYITTGVRPAIVSSTKADYRSVVRLWMHSDAPKQAIVPQLTFDNDYPKKYGLPNFRMLDEVTYKTPDGATHNLFTEVPRYVSPVSLTSPISLTSQSSESDMLFRASVEVPEGCTECLVILRQTYHPSWKATVDGEPVEPFAVFPFYTAIKLDTPGQHEIIFSYEPSLLKKSLLILTLTLCIIFAIIHTYDYYKYLSSGRSEKTS